MSKRWVRFMHAGTTGFGSLDGEQAQARVQVHSGSMFDRPEPTGRTLVLADVKLLAPTQPSKVVALWNNFKALGEKLKLSAPSEPLYFLKSPNSFLNPGETIVKPPGDGKVVFEGELGVVVGKACKDVSEAEAMDHVFGYTCANDVTSADELNRDPTFAQWVRAKGHDTFCPFGPCVATGLDPTSLRVKTTLNGDVRQDYPVSDMRFTVAQLVAMISHDMTLMPGDIILCGTSIGVGSMKPGSTVEIEIGGIGSLVNGFE
jgi:2-keto-4-pentenoate hydratase/2-oxohepta-3-ene-1,7-dioic acid hydratase in catechol pathway